MAGNMSVDRGSFAGSAPIIDNALLKEVASNAVRVSGDFVDGVHKATRDIANMNIPVDAENIEFRSGDDLTKPVLTPARAEAKGRFAVTQLVAELGEILGAAVAADLMGQIETFKSLAEARKKSLEQASDEFSAATDDAEGAVKQFEAAHAATAAAQTAFNTAQGRVKQAQIDVAQAKLNATPENDDLIGAQQKLKQAQQAFLTAGKTLKKSAEQEQPLYDAAKQKTGLAIDMETRAVAALAAAGATSGTPEHRSALEKLGSSSARLSLLMTTLSLLIGESGEASVKNDQELFNSMQAERQKTLEKAAADYEAEVRKAEQIGKTMGCIGKIIGGILTAVSLLAIPFTGGASAVLAVIGVGMMAADAITTAATGGTSLTSMAMAPIMANVIQPLIAEIGKMIATALQVAGVPKEEAERVSSIIAMVVVAVAMLVLMIGISVVVKNSAVLNKFLTSVSRTLSKGINKGIAKAMAKGAGKSFGSSMDKLTGSMAKAAPDVTRNLSNLSKEMASKEMEFALGMAHTGLGTVKSTVEGSGQIAAGVFIGRAANFEADMVVSTNDLEHIRQLLSDAAEKFLEMFKSANQLNVAASDAARQIAATGAFVLNHTRA